MAAECSLTPDAAQDVDEAYAWYENQRAGLGEEFLGCLDVCIERIRNGFRRFTADTGALSFVSFPFFRFERRPTHCHGDSTYGT